MKVSIIMPTYNREKYVKEAIDSILMQTFSDFELIIIDDCSTDNTVPIVRSIKDERIRLIENSFKCNLPILRNQGVKLAVGDYIAYMDSDDISTPYRIKKEVDFLEKHSECGVVSCSFEVFGDRQFTVSLPTSNDDICGNLLTRCSMNNGGCLIRRDLFDNGMQHRNEFFVCDDYVFWVDLIGLTKMANIDEVLLKVRFGEHQMTRRSMTIPIEQNLRRALLGEIHRLCFLKMGMMLSDRTICRYNTILNTYKKPSEYSKEDIQEIMDIYHEVSDIIEIIHPEYSKGFSDGFRRRFPYFLI